MNMTRRSFVYGLGLTMVHGVVFGGGVVTGSSGVRLLRLGVMSDVHIHEKFQKEYYKKALEFFRDRGVDAVVLAGDIADSWLVSDLRFAGECWREVFPNDKGADGRHVEKLFVYGNHDMDIWDRQFLPYARTIWKDEESLRKHVIPLDPAGAWKSCFGEEWAPIYAKTVNGVVFICAHWGHTGELDGFIKANAKKLGLDGPRPFFFVQHQHPGNTVYGPDVCGNDGGVSSYVLRNWPNAVALSGHSHMSLTDERSVWQGAFTSIGTGCVTANVCIEDNAIENGDKNRWDWSMPGWNRRRIMSRLPSWGRQCMVMDVYADRLRVSRHDLVYPQSLGPDWDVPVPVPDDPPYSFANRKKGRVAPEFSAGAVVKAVVTEKRPECASSTVQGPFVHVTFPAAKTVKDCRVHTYRICAIDDGGLVIKERRVYAPAFYHGLSKAWLPGECLFLASEFPKCRAVRFEVRPVECFGHEGRPILSDRVLLSTNKTGS